jgi:DMSO/TMAO reductase YedYZ molybdopterin-dependent catalytic subunit
MRHPETSARQVSVPQTSVSLSALLRPVTGTQEPANGTQPLAAAQQVQQAPEVQQAAPGHVLPPGQYVPKAWPALHYGPVPKFHPGTWDLRVSGATESGREHRWSWDEIGSLPRCRVVADFHCVTKFTIPAVAWEGIAAAELLRAAPPADAVTHVMVWADYGYSANLTIDDFAADDTLLATHRNGAELTPEHGYPLRLVVPSRYAWKSVKWVRAIEYLTCDRRGFWEERGYHNIADPWREQRYSYQELPDEGPPL